MNGAGAAQVRSRSSWPSDWGAHVTGVDNAATLKFMRALGADDVIDYRKEDFTQSELTYDLILYLVASRSVFAYRCALAPTALIAASEGPHER